ncbi:MAG: baseplate assembly protein [Spirochaetes bacterium GWB1_59_5]|nr:MAG: baseplate assembly protein [Spirochaetes bacterium GWB1_59_5]
MDDIFGEDIKLDDSGQALVAANGELLLTAGAETGVQDIRLRLGTPLGELFYDSEFGGLIHEWYRDENSQSNRNAFEAEVEQRVEEDPRVVLGTVSCKVASWNEHGFTAHAAWEFIGEDHPFNLVISYDANKKEMVIRDVNPRSGL